jgi:hypothetical protein
MGKAVSYSALIAELGLAKAINIDTAEDDAKIAEAAGEDEGGEIHPDDAAIANMFRKVVDVVSALRRDVDEIRAELGVPKGRGGQPMTKAMRLRNQAQMTGPEFMAKAMGAQTAGRLTSIQVATAEACINASKPPPRDIIAAVIG